MKGRKLNNIISKYYYKDKKAFSLIELIIVITILVILTSISFLNFSDYWSKARDSVRIYDFNLIQKALEIYKVKNWKFPEPDDPISIENTSLNKNKYKWFIEGKIWAEVSKKLNFSEIPKDPKTKEEYKYMITDDRKNYILRIKKEDWGELSIWWIPTSCEKIKELWLFKWNWLYPIFFTTRWPIDVFCHENYNKDFYQFILWWDMEVDEKTFLLKPWVSFSEDENHTENWSKSLKFTRLNIISTNHFTYVKPQSKYTLTWKVKIKRNWFWGKWIASIWFQSFDENFQRIYPWHVRVLEWSETTISRNLISTDKTIYFNCNDNLYNLLKNNLKFTSVVVYDVDDTWEYKDLPNRNMSSIISNEKTQQNKNSNYIRNNFLKKVSQTECSLKTLNDILPPWFLSKPIWTKIRFHLNENWLNYAKPISTFIDWEWRELNLVVNWQKKILTEHTPHWFFWPWTKFIKIEIKWNSWNRYEWWLLKKSDDTSFTYFDDLKLEITN